MSTELSNGVIIPEEYSDDWYDEMSINLRKLNDVITAASDNATDIQRLDTAKANQSDLTALTSRVSQNETDITALQTAVSGALKREIVQTLPTEDISTTTIYMIRNSESSGTNIYDEYMYINSQWELIGTSATDFSNYYTKTESDNLLSAKANQTDLTALGGRVTQTETDITALQTAVSGALKREIVQSLPTQDISTTTIYMIRNTTTSGDNIYDEYMYINNLWELIGTSATDFSNYYTKTEIDTLLSGKQASLSQTQLDAVNSGIDSSKVQQIATNTSDISSLQSGKANDSDVVHKSGDETISGVKTFSSNVNVYNSDSSTDTANIVLKNSKAERGSTTNIVEQNIFFLDKDNAQLGQIKCEVDANGYSNISIQCSDINDSSAGVQVRKNLTGIVFRPTNDNQCWLGQNGRRWYNTYTSRINGLTPSSLSMPATTGTVDISSYITDLTGTANTYTVLVNGYIQFDVTGSSVEIDVTNGLSQKWIMTDPKGFIPVVSGASVSIKVVGTAINNFKFIPCQANI